MWKQRLLWFLDGVGLGIAALVTIAGLGVITLAVSTWVMMLFH